MPITERVLHDDFLYRAGGDLDGRITQHKLFAQHMLELFDGPVVTGAVGGAAAAGTTGATNQLTTARGNLFEYHVKGAGQTIVSPVATTRGLDISQDLTDNEGAEYTNGIIADARRRNVFKVGTDLPFFVRAKLRLADASGTDDLCVGFRKAEAYQANVDDYDEAAWLGVGQGAAGRYNSETILNNAATVTTNLGLTAWADGETHELEVRVGGNGAVSYYVDGVRATAAPAFSFDTGELVIPFLYFLHGADVAETTELIEWEYGFQDMKTIL